VKQRKGDGDYQATYCMVVRPGQLEERENSFHLLSLTLVLDICINTEVRHVFLVPACAHNCDWSQTWRYWMCSHQQHTIAL